MVVTTSISLDIGRAIATDENVTKNKVAMVLSILNIIDIVFMLMFIQFLHFYRHFIKM